MRRTEYFRTFSLAFVLVAASLVGCSGTEKSICDKGRQCYGGNDNDYNACVQTLVYEGKIAADYGCSSAFATVLTCIEATSICETTPVIGTKFLKSSCGDQANALESCERAASTKSSDHFLTIDKINQSLMPSSGQ